MHLLLIASLNWLSENQIGFFFNYRLPALHNISVQIRNGGSEGVVNFSDVKWTEIEGKD